jgi:hypothetical protein
MAKHDVQIQTSGRLIQSPQCFRIIGIEFEQLSKESLRNLSGRQIHAVQGTKQRQQIQSGGFQTCEGQPECRPERDVPRPEHRASLGGGQSAAIAEITRAVKN